MLNKTELHVQMPAVIANTAGLQCLLEGNGTNVP